MIPVVLSDRVLLIRETICGLARKHGLKALFVPKIDRMKAGNGCHLHLSIYMTNNQVRICLNKRHQQWCLKRRGRQQQMKRVGLVILENPLWKES